MDVVVAAYNSRDMLRACVKPLVQTPWVEITVVDNASPDDSAAIVADLPLRGIKRRSTAASRMGATSGSLPERPSSCCC